MVDIVPLIETCCEQIDRDYPNVDINVSLPEETLICAHPLINSALRNVIEDAVEHNNREHPRVKIESVAFAFEKRGGEVCDIWFVVNV
jgi:K+-sensing histidine kinase KdpD